MYKSTEKSSASSSSSSSQVSPSIPRNYDITVGTLDDKYYYIRLKGDEKSTILDLKSEIEKQTGVPVAQQNLIVCGQILKDEMCLAGYRIEMLTNMRLKVIPDPTKASSSSASPSSSAPTPSLFGPPLATPPTQSSSTSTVEASVTEAISLFPTCRPS